MGRSVDILLALEQSIQFALAAAILKLPWPGWDVSGRVFLRPGKGCCCTGEQMACSEF
jgi:hypothetical protein